MAEVERLPLFFPQGSNILCVNTDAAQQSVVNQGIGDRCRPVALIDAKDTYAAREWLNAAQGQPASQGVPLPSVVLVGYDPEERWSLAVLLSELRNLDAAIEVVLIADGPTYSLPVFIGDYPWLTVVPSDFHAVDRWAVLVRRLVVAAFDSAAPWKVLHRAE